MFSPRTVWLVAAVAAGACADSGRRADPAPSQHVLRAEPLPELARSLLKKRMGRHGKDLERLVDATLILDYETTAALAEAVAAEPRISRPEAQLDSANALFPDRFFELQDLLAIEAGALGVAARAHDADRTSAAFGRLSGTCVSCHAVYASLPSN